MFWCLFPTDKSALGCCATNTATVAHNSPKGITNDSHTPVTRQVSSVNWIAQRLHVQREKSRGVFWLCNLTASFHFQKIITMLVQLTGHISCFFCCGMSFQFCEIIDFNASYVSLSVSVVEVSCPFQQRAESILCKKTKQNKQI